MAEHDIKVQELSTGRGNTLIARLDLATGTAHILDDAVRAREVTEATRRALQQSKALRIIASSEA